jgi:hypothetical protein
VKCNDKRHYLTREAAEAGASRTIRASHGRKMYAYLCPACKLWHLTTWTPEYRAAVVDSWAAERAARPTKPQSPVEPPTVKALRTRLVEVTASMRLDERRRDAARRKRAEEIGKLVAADELLRKAEDDYRAAQLAALKLLGM